MRRMAIAVVALLGLINAAYLTLHAYGIIGELACGIVAGCDTVQASKWSRFLGLPVAVWGAGYFASVLALALVSLEDRFADSIVVQRGLLLLTGWGFAFSAWMTWLEAFQIKAWCQYCLVSAALALVAFGLAVWDWIVERRASGVGREM
jgi:uncharacterized membrane protein